MVKRRESYIRWALSTNSAVIDADGDGCNSRNEVLIAEATVAPTVGSSCRLSGGAWYSYYDDTSYTATASLDIDHMVALAEAWDSGARTWTTARRQAYANDLGDDRTLIAVNDTEARWADGRHSMGIGAVDKPAICTYIPQPCTRTRSSWERRYSAAGVRNGPTCRFRWGHCVCRCRQHS